MHWQVAKTVDAQLGSLGGQRLVPLGQGDEDSGKMEEQFKAWSGVMLQALKDGPSEEGAAQIEGDAQSDGCAAGTPAYIPQWDSMPSACKIPKRQV